MAEEDHSCRSTEIFKSRHHELTQIDPQTPEKLDIKSAYHSRRSFLWLYENQDMHENDQKYVDFYSKKMQFAGFTL